MFEPVSSERRHRRGPPARISWPDTRPYGTPRLPTIEEMTITWPWPCRRKIGAPRARVVGAEIVDVDELVHLRRRDVVDAPGNAESRVAHDHVEAFEPRDRARDQADSCRSRPSRRRRRGVPGRRRADPPPQARRVGLRARAEDDSGAAARQAQRGRAGSMPPMRRDDDNSMGSGAGDAVLLSMHVPPRSLDFVRSAGRRADSYESAERSL